MIRIFFIIMVLTPLLLQSEGLDHLRACWEANRDALAKKCKLCGSWESFEKSAQLLSEGSILVSSCEGNECVGGVWLSDERSDRNLGHAVAVMVLEKTAAMSLQSDEEGSRLLSWLAERHINFATLSSHLGSEHALPLVLALPLETERNAAVETYSGGGGTLYLCRITVQKLGEIIGRHGDSLRRRFCVPVIKLMARKYLYVLLNGRKLGDMNIASQMRTEVSELLSGFEIGKEGYELELLRYLSILVFSSDLEQLPAVRDALSSRWDEVPSSVRNMLWFRLQLMGLNEELDRLASTVHGTNAKP